MTKKHSTKYLLPFLVILILAACSRQSRYNANNGVIAQVGSKVLTVNGAKSDIPVEVLKKDSLKALLKYRDGWVREQLLVQEAKRNGFDERPGFQKKLNEMKNQLLAQMMRTYVLSHSDTSAITDQEAQNYYEAHQDQFILNERYVKFRHLIAASLDSAQKARQDLLHGVSWKTVVQRYSLHPDDQLRSSERFWPISLAAHDYPIMNRYLHIIGNMEISPIRFIDGRYHFVQLTDQRPKGSHPDIKWVLARIKEWLKLEKRRKTLSTFEQNLYLRAESNNEINLPTGFLKASTDSTGSVKSK